jgi:FtsH-binding integral membrane protein
MSAEAAAGHGARRGSARAGSPWPLALDVLAVVAFVVIGRSAHAKGESLAGIASTAWPFLAGLGAGWVAGSAWRRPAALLPTGVAAWLACVVLGMVLRVVAGQGTAAAFVAVALGFLGLTMLGWRLAARLWWSRHHAAA